MLLRAVDAVAGREGVAAVEGVGFPVAVLPCTEEPKLCLLEPLFLGEAGFCLGEAALGLRLLCVAVPKL